MGRDGIPASGQHPPQLGQGRPGARTSGVREHDEIGPASIGDDAAARRPEVRRVADRAGRGLVTPSRKNPEATTTAQAIPAAARPKARRPRTVTITPSPSGFSSAKLEHRTMRGGRREITKAASMGRTREKTGQAPAPRRTSRTPRGHPWPRAGPSARVPCTTPGVKSSRSSIGHAQGHAKEGIHNKATFGRQHSWAEDARTSGAADPDRTAGTVAAVLGKSGPAC